MASSLYKANTTFMLDTAAATTNATSVKVTATELFNIHAYNAAASVRYLKIYNLAVAPTVGTSVPILTFGIPAGGTINIQWAKGLYLSTGLAFAMTTGATTASTAALTANDVTGLSISYS